MPQEKTAPDSPHVDSKKNIALLINTQSKKGQQNYDEVLSTLRAAGCTPTNIYAVKKGFNLQETMHQIMNSKPDLLIVGSGDGTVSALSGYLAHSSTVLGYIPLGTTNNFGRNLNIPLDIHGAVDIIANGKVADVNLGIMNGHYFVNMANFGVSMLVARGIPNTLKQVFGRAAYGIYSIITILKHRPLTIIVSNGANESRFVTHQFSVANGSRHAGIGIAVDAHIDSNQLLAYSLGSSNRFSTLASAFQFLFSAHVPSAKKGFIQAEQLSLTVSRPQLVELDGEIRDTTRQAQFDFGLDIDALNVMVPQEFTDI